MHGPYVCGVYPWYSCKGAWPDKLSTCTKKQLLAFRLSRSYDIQQLDALCPILVAGPQWMITILGILLKVFEVFQFWHKVYHRVSYHYTPATKYLHLGSWGSCLQACKWHQWWKTKLSTHYLDQNYNENYTAYMYIACPNLQTKQH